MTGPSVFSPYGKDVEAELRTVYGFADVEALVASMSEQLGRVWGLRAEIDQVHVAFGIALRFRSGPDCYYLKLASTGSARAPRTPGSASPRSPPRPPGAR